MNETPRFSPDLRQARTWFIYAISGCVVLAILLTTVSGFSHKERVKQFCVSENQCHDYTTYGWPSDWRTNAPSEAKANDGVCGYGVIGVSACRYIVAATAWAFILSPGIPIATFLGWFVADYAYKRRDSRPPPSVPGEA